jgi:hypothetical protein
MVQQILCEFWRIVALHGRTLQEAQRPEDRRHLHALQGRLSVHDTSHTSVQNKSMGGVMTASVMVKGTISSGFVSIWRPYTHERSL